MMLPAIYTIFASSFALMPCASEALGLSPVALLMLICLESANLCRLIAAFKVFTTDRQQPQSQSGASDRPGHECLYAVI